MATRERPIERAARTATADLRRVGQEIRTARAGAGLSLRAVAPVIGLSPAQIARIERGDARTVPVRHLAAMGAAVGLDIRVHAYPGPDPIRDAGQVRLLERFRAWLPPELGFRTEVPLPIPGDLRAWDAYLTGLRPVAETRSTVPVEAETRFTDTQATTRRLARKQRDSDEPYLILVVADTRSNRAAVAAARASLGSEFPISARAAIAALRRGEHPGGSALVFA